MLDARLGVDSPKPSSPAKAERPKSRGWGDEQSQRGLVQTEEAPEPGGEFLEARMNLTALSLTFQRHLAMLVRVEMRKQGGALRLLLRSEAIPDLIAWLTSPAW